MIQLKLSQRIQVVCMQDYLPATTDFLIFSNRSKGVLRISAEFMAHLKGCEFLMLPEPLLILLLQFEILVTAEENELLTLAERTLSDFELVQYARTAGLVQPI